MDYGRFVRTRQPLWDEFERGLTRARDGAALDHAALETLAFRYRQVLHDHALAAARYPDTGSARRLWRLALEGTQWLQRDRGPRTVGVWGFFTRVVPLALRSLRPHLAVATVLFASSALIGLSLAIVQPSMGAVFLGPTPWRACARGGCGRTRSPPPCRRRCRRPPSRPTTWASPSPPGPAARWPGWVRCGSSS